MAWISLQVDHNVAMIPRMASPLHSAINCLFSGVVCCINTESCLVSRINLGYKSSSLSSDTVMVSRFFVESLSYWSHVHHGK